MMFAAGFGTRMGALTADRPKPLIKVAGKPLIDHALNLVDEFGADRTVVNLHYRPEMLEDYLADRVLQFSREEPDILETGGGLRQALPMLGEGPVFTMNTDAVWRGPNPLSLLAQAWNPDIMDALLLCIPPENAIGHNGDGDFHLSDEGSLRRGAGLIYSGVQIIKPEGVHDIPETSFSLNLLWDQMLESGRLHGLAYTGQWCDVGHPEGIAQAEAMLDV